MLTTFTPKARRVLSVGFVIAIAAFPAAAGASNRHSHRHRGHSLHHRGIPQHNGGDRDSDNNGAASDGDGNA
jgi:hypothetical protein